MFFHRLDKHGNCPTAKSKGSVVSKELGGLRVRASETYNVYLIGYTYIHIMFNSMYSLLYIYIYIHIYIYIIPYTTHYLKYEKAKQDV